MDLTQIVLNFGGEQTSPFLYRSQSKGDKGVIQQIFVNRDYDLTRLTRARDIAAEYERILQAGNTPLIIDCGANIGASPVWFARAFPKAKIFALEPEPHNYAILRKNCQEYSSIASERAAISCMDEAVYLEDHGQGDWGFRTTTRPTTGTHSLPAYSIDTVVKRFPQSELLLVKIDIEGGEARLFESNYQWIERAMVIIVELHDWLMPGTANSRNCLRALSQHNRDFVFLGENVFSIRNG